MHTRLYFIGTGNIAQAHFKYAMQHFCNAPVEIHATDRKRQNAYARKLAHASLLRRL